MLSAFCPSLPTSYTVSVEMQGLDIPVLCNRRTVGRGSVPRMGTKRPSSEWKTRIGQRIQQLRMLKKMSLSSVERQTGLQISTVSNWEQGLRLPGPAEAVILGKLFAVAPAHILCLDDEDVPALSKLEADLILNFRTLPENERESYRKRIETLAMAYRVSVPDERVEETGYRARKVYEGDD